MARLPPLLHECRKISNDREASLGRVAQTWNPCAKSLEDWVQGEATHQAQGTASSDAKSPRQRRVCSLRSPRQQSLSGPSRCAKSKMQGVFSLSRGYRKLGSPPAISLPPATIMLYCSNGRRGGFFYKTNYPALLSSLQHYQPSCSLCTEGCRQEAHHKILVNHLTASGGSV